MAVLLDNIMERLDRLEKQVKVLQGNMTIGRRELNSLVSRTEGRNDGGGIADSVEVLGN